MIRFLESFFVSLFPNRCAYCAEVIPSDELTCLKCRESLPRIEGDICYKCGREKTECRCRQSEKYYKAVVAPFYFQNEVRRGLHFFKFRNGKDNYRAYSIEMAKTVKKRYADIKFDYIISVPMSDESKKKRGFDQCELLARGISEIIGTEYYPDALKKIYNTNIQHGLGYVFRKGNLSGAFEVSEPEKVKGKTFLLVDDVSTSGETLDECAKMLWLYDAECTCCVTVALTKKKEKMKERR